MGLRQEAPLVLLALARGAGQGQADGLEADGPAECGVAGLVDDAHHAAAELPADLVLAYRPGEIFFGSLAHPIGPPSSREEMKTPTY
jgi:hypothetical protein